MTQSPVKQRRLLRIFLRVLAFTVLSVVLVSAGGAWFITRHHDIVRQWLPDTAKEAHKGARYAQTEKAPKGAGDVLLSGVGALTCALALFALMKRINHQYGYKDEPNDD